ncbi:MAG: nucleoside phosphorylase, partial [Halodesulfurarchaeum sp.]
AAYTLTWLEDTDQRVGAVGAFGIGAPVTAALVEEFATLGTEVFCILGGAGTLQPDVTGRDALVVEAAIRDEGTSHHYLEPERTVEADERLTELLSRHADGLAETVYRGPTWTIDAIFRETDAEIRDYSEAGVLAVEMEAAAVFAVASYRNLHAGALLVAFDSLADSEWNARVDDTERRLQHFVPGVRDAIVDRLERR